MIKKCSLIFILIILLGLAYGIYSVSYAQSLIKNSVAKMQSLNTLYYTGGFFIYANDKLENYSYDFNAQYKNPNQAVVLINKTVNSNKLKYKLFLDNNKIYVKEKNSWRETTNEQAGYLLNPYAPLTMDEIINSLNLLSSIPYMKGKTKINNSNVEIISVNLDTNKLTDLYKSKEKDSKVFKNFMTKLQPSGQYLLYIDPTTKYLHRLEINISTTANEKKYNYRTTYSFLKFNSPISIPKL